VTCPSLFYTTPGTVGSSATAILESGLAQGQTVVADDVPSIPMARFPTCVEERGLAPGVSMPGAHAEVVRDDSHASWKEPGFILPLDDVPNGGFDLVLLPKITSAPVARRVQIGRPDAAKLCSRSRRELHAFH